MKFAYKNKEYSSVDGVKDAHWVGMDFSDCFVFDFYTKTANSGGYDSRGGAYKIKSMVLDGVELDVTQAPQYSVGLHKLTIRLLPEYANDFKFGYITPFSSTGANNIISIHFPECVTTCSNDVFYNYHFNVVQDYGDNPLWLTFPNTLTKVGARFSEIFAGATVNKPVYSVLTSPTKIVNTFSAGVYGMEPFYTKYSGNRIYVPNNLLAEYKADAYWSNNNQYASRIYGYTSIVNGIPV